MKKYLLFSLLLIIGVALAPLARTADASLLIRGAWIKQLPPIIPVRAGYVRISNPTDRPVRLVAGDSPDFERIEMHETRMANGNMTMLKAASFAVPAHGELLLQPGGKHLMLFNPARPLEAGDQVEIDLRFDHGDARPVRFTVRP